MLIPRKILFGNPEKTNPQISPDGRRLAYIAPDPNNVLQVWARTLGGQDDAQLTADKKRGIRSYFWAYDGDHLVYQQDSDGDENWHLYSVHLETRLVRDLTPFQGVQARLVDADSAFPHELLVAMNVKDRRKHDVYRIDLRNGAVEFDTDNPGNVVGWTADAQLQVRAATAATPDGGYDLLLRETPHVPWKVLRHWGPEDQGGAAGFSKDGKQLYLMGSHGANALRLLSFNLASGLETVVAEDPEYDVGGVFMHPLERTLQAVSFNRDLLEWQVLDPAVAQDFAAIAKIHRGQFGVPSRDLADRTWLVSCVTDDGPVYYYRYDRASKTAELLFSHQPQLEGLPLAKMNPISYKASDGLTIHGYLTTPAGQPAKNLPAVLLVHGGPWARDAWGFHPLVQWLANRGYAVLQPNFRGSTGYGKKFLNAGNREWAGKMHQDLIDGVDWLVAQGVADKKRVAIMGGSYGGYATLVGLTFTPEVFAAGVDIVGPSDIVTLMKTIPPYWAPAKAMFEMRVGKLETEEDFLKSRSPLYFIDRIRSPLLIGQGANDPRVKQSESDQIVEALRGKGKPVEYVLYQDEGHGFARPENRLHFYAKTEEFLSKYLGGPCEPLNGLQGHSAVLR